MTRIDWLTDLRSWIDRHGRSGGFALCLPMYRPDLVAAAAADLDLVLVDFRRTHLARLGWRASGVPLDALTAAVEAEMAEGNGVVLQNAEALLSLHAEQQRRAWFAAALSRPWPRTLLLPVALFAADLPPLEDRIHRLAPDAVPEESLLMRLSGL